LACIDGDNVKPEPELALWEQVKDDYLSKVVITCIMKGCEWDSITVALVDRVLDQHQKSEQNERADIIIDVWSKSFMSGDWKTGEAHGLCLVCEQNGERYCGGNLSLSRFRRTKGTLLVDLEWY
jgi:hypothetical protein